MNPHPWASCRALRARLSARLYSQSGATMDQLELLPEHTISVEAVIGLTPWVNAALKPPPTTGYWKTRMASSPNMQQPQRRWWNGRVFSHAIVLHHDDSEAMGLEQDPALIPLSNLEWCGLKLPYPGVYPYRLFSF